MLAMNSLKGHLLVAAELMLDPLFIETVVLVLEHNEAGAVGVILNCPTRFSTANLPEEIFEGCSAWGKPIHLGGPTWGSTLVLHTIKRLADSEILPGVYSSADGLKFQQAVCCQPEPSLIVLAYTAWKKGQLESEIEKGSWLVHPAAPRHVFWDRAPDLWETVVREIQAADFAKIVGIREMPADLTVN